MNQEQLVLIGGPLDGQPVTVASSITRIDTPYGRYIRLQLSPRVSGFVFSHPGQTPTVLQRPETPPAPNRWAKKVRPNPFPSAAR